MMRIKRVIKVIRNKILPKQQLRNKEKTDKRRKRRSVTRKRKIRSRLMHQMTPLNPI